MLPMGTQFFVLNGISDFRVTLTNFKGFAKSKDFLSLSVIAHYSLHNLLLEIQSAHQKHSSHTPQTHSIHSQTDTHLKDN